MRSVLVCLPIVALMFFFSTTSLTVPRFVLSLMLLLFVPGLCILDILYKWINFLTMLQQMTLSIGLSMAANMLADCVLSYLRISLNSSNLLTSAAMLSLALGLIAFISSRQRISTKLTDESAIAVLSMIAITLGSLLIRGISLILNGTSTLLDLDAFRLLRIINLIYSNGVLPTFDPLSAAPNGTTATFAFSHGYYFFISQLGVISGISPPEVLVISPLIFLTIELIGITAVCQLFSNSKISLLLSAFFLIGFSGWAAIAELGGDPIAENAGVFLYLIVILLVVSSVRQKSFYIVPLTSFLIGITIEVHPVTYYFTVLTVLSILPFYLVSKKWRASGIIILSVAGSLFSIILLLLDGVNLTSESTFSFAAKWLALLRPHDYTITGYSLVSEVGFIVVLLAVISMIVIVSSKCESNYFLLSAALLMFLVMIAGEFAVFTPYGITLTLIPFYAPLFLTHRLMPYFPTVLSILAGISVTEFVLPGIKRVARPKLVRLLGPIIIVLIVLGSYPQIMTAYQYTNSYANGETGATLYTGTFVWIDGHTTNSSIFMSNFPDLGEWIRSLANRPVVFTTSEEDLNSPNLIQRVDLQTCVFVPVCQNTGTLQLLQNFSVNYVMLANHVSIIDENSSSYIFFNDNSTYLSWFQSRPFLKLVYSDSNALVFAVNG